MELETLLHLLAMLVVGRLCLSLLPPGWPGYHDRSELGPTLCASWLLGLAGLYVLPWKWLWLAVLVLRLATLPGGLRPRHERDRDLHWGWTLLAIACLASNLMGDDLVYLCSLTCCGAFIVSGVQFWKRRADRRSRALAIVSGAVLMGMLILKNLP